MSDNIDLRLNLRKIMGVFLKDCCSTYCFDPHRMGGDHHPQFCIENQPAVRYRCLFTLFGCPRGISKLFTMEEANAYIMGMIARAELRTLCELENSIGFLSAKLSFEILCHHFSDIDIGIDSDPFVVLCDLLKAPFLKNEMWWRADELHRNLLASHDALGKTVVNGFERVDCFSREATAAHKAIAFLYEVACAQSHATRLENDRITEEASDDE
jgi:hypothetical protein